MIRPDFPIGPHAAIPHFSQNVADELRQTLHAAPARLRRVVAELSEAQLETRYRNWTIRQIVHHLVDSHLHSFLRFKLALTENIPVIKPYEEADWVELADSKHAPLEPSLLLLDGLHQRWVGLLITLNEADLSRSFFHPQQNREIDLWSALQYYAWHTEHHIGQIRWLRERVL